MLRLQLIRRLRENLSRSAIKSGAVTSRRPAHMSEGSSAECAAPPLRVSP